MELLEHQSSRRGSSRQLSPQAYEQVDQEPDFSPRQRAVTGVGRDDAANGRARLRHKQLLPAASEDQELTVALAPANRKLRQTARTKDVQGAIYFTPDARTLVHGGIPRAQRSAS
eukprot:COSAG04_NODE_223_length_19649_cov_12.486650_10_plen_115_part_00